MTKRLFDIFFSILGLLILCPIFLGISLLILIIDGPPIFFQQERVGRYGKSFKIWKFRTMNFKISGPLITVAGDKRITRIGKLLRLYKLDELPQVINVLKGDMSFVGPRPEVQKYVDLYTEEQRKVLNYLPGITDPASLKYHNESEILKSSVDYEKLYIKEIMPDKLSINLQYLAERSLIKDAKIILKTIIQA
jgi:lipopolysaccharide/colanic/teichoic acid biosynthesis glycosyltransferase